MPAQTNAAAASSLCLQGKRMIQEAARGGPAACTTPRRRAQAAGCLRFAWPPVRDPVAGRAASIACMHAASRRALGYSSTAAAFTASNFFMGGFVWVRMRTTIPLDHTSDPASEQMRSADELVNAHILPLVFLVSAFSISAAAHEPCTPAVLPMLFFISLSSGLLLLPRVSNWPRLLNCLRSSRRPTLMHRPAKQQQATSTGGASRPVGTAGAGGPSGAHGTIEAS